jgi:hypothetical protein
MQSSFLNGYEHTVGATPFIVCVLVQQGEHEPTASTMSLFHRPVRSIAVQMQVHTCQKRRRVPLRLDGRRSSLSAGQGMEDERTMYNDTRSSFIWGPIPIPPLGSNNAVSVNVGSHWSLSDSLVRAMA